MAGRRPAAVKAREKPARAPSVYSAQAVADFCEVDLKTVHHWADRGRIVHHRTEGRHLRFRRNDVVRFLRAHGYPLPEGLTRARPTVALALGSLDGSALSLDELAKRLGSRFSVRRHGGAIGAIARLVAEMPDAFVFALDDPSVAAARTIAALKTDPATSWILVATLGADEGLASSRGAGAEIALSARDAVKLPSELARALAVS
ncbi:MAG: helix-turn-helix domain-containing protein [Labilithrix sp.]|nr:helix-turn-helix domain-containing protein [Labilithrix sp.]